MGMVDKAYKFLIISGLAWGVNLMSPVLGLGSLGTLTAIAVFVVGTYYAVIK